MKKIFFERLEVFLLFQRLHSSQSQRERAKISPSLLPKKGAAYGQSRTFTLRKVVGFHGQSSAGALANTTYHTLNTATNSTLRHGVGEKAS